MKKRKSKSSKSKSSVPRTSRRLLRSSLTNAIVNERTVLPVSEYSLLTRTLHAKQGLLVRPTRTNTRAEIQRLTNLVAHATVLDSRRQPPTICSRRTERSEVLFAKNKAGFSGSAPKRHYKVDETSKVKC